LAAFCTFQQQVVQQINVFFTSVILHKLSLDSTLRVTYSVEGFHFQTMFTSYANMG